MINKWKLLNNKLIDKFGRNLNDRKGILLRQLPS